MTTPVRNLDPITFPLSGSALIEASAGTGKTYTLALLYLRLVLQHGGQNGFDFPLLPPNILVVTFTKAATQELRDRIRARLVEAAAYFRGDLDDEDADALLKTLKSDTEKQRDLSGAARQLEVAAEWMDEAAVSTIHSWCSRVLSEHAFYSGLNFSQTLLENEKPLIMRACEDYWRENVFPLDEEPLREVMRYFQAPSNLYRLLQNLIYQTDAIPPVEPDLGSRIMAILNERADRIDAMKQGVASVIDQLEQEFVDAYEANLYKRGSLNKTAIPKTSNSLREWASSSDTDLSILKRLLGQASLPRMALMDLDMWKDRQNIPIDKASANVLAELPEQIKALTTPREYLIAHATHWIANRVEAEKAQQGVLSQSDLLVKLDEALQGPGGERLANVIRQQFPVALVDEFQDTDPVQYRIFNAIYRVAAPYPQTGFFMIGDPKQAIYRFRGADIFTYLAAKRDTGERQYTLGKNFRSAPGLVSRVNAYFEFAERTQSKGAFLFRQKNDNPIAFHPVDAGQPDQVGLYIDGNKVDEQNLWYLPFENDEGETNKWDRAEITADQIANLLNLSQTGQATINLGKTQRALMPSDFAILVHTGTQAKAIRQSLFLRGVSSVYLSDKNDVYDSEEARDILDVLRAMSEPYDSYLLRIALGTRLMGMPLLELDRLNRDEVFWEAQIEQFRDYHVHWQRYGVMAVLHRFYHEQKVAERYLSAANGERAITDLFHITELLQQASESVQGQVALIHHLEQCITREKSGEESTQQRLESDADLVQVVTVHKSKGLQYPIVMLPYFDYVREVKGKDGYVDFHDQNGDLVLALKPDETDLALADSERLAEDVRKLYVAMTRGICAQWIAVEEPKGTKKDELPELTSAAHVLVGSDHQSVLAQYIKLTDAFSYVEPFETKQTFHDLCQFDFRPAHIAGDKNMPAWWITSYSAVKFGYDVSMVPAPENAKDEQLNDDEDGVVADSANASKNALSMSSPTESDKHDVMQRLKGGSQTGTFLHSLIEWAADHRAIVGDQHLIGFHAAVEDDRKRDQVLQARCTKRELVDEAEALSAWLKAFLTHRWTFDRLPHESEPVSIRLQDLKPKQVAVEMEFMFSVNQVQARDMDRLVTQHTLSGSPRPLAAFDVLNGMLKGFIDMVAEINGKYYVIDWKSNTLGASPGDYHEEALVSAVLKKRYDLQYTLYLLALHRHLRGRIDGYSYEKHIGGAVYYFLRGWKNTETQGLMMEKPPFELIDQLDILFATGKLGGKHD